MTMSSSKPNRWAWMPEHMPGVMAKVAEMRKTYGAEWLATCWKNGVVLAQPGWFWACEGALAVGVPFDARAIETHLLAQAVSPTTVTVVIRAPEGAGNVA